MMKRLLIACFLFAASLPAFAEGLPSALGPGAPSAIGIGPNSAFNLTAAIGPRAAQPGPAYVGPGDVVASWYAQGGVRAFSAATAGLASMDIFCVTASTTNTIKTLPNGNLDTQTLVRLCPADTYHVAKLYDRSGQTNCTAAACDWTQGTDANRPVLVLNCQNAQPCMTFNGSQYLVNTALSSLATPTFIAAVIRTGNTGAVNTIMSSNNTLPYFSSGSGTANMFGNGGSNCCTISGLTENAWYAMQGQVNGASSTLNFDNAGNSKVASGSVGAATTISGNLAIGVDDNSGVFNQFLTGKMLEVGVRSAGYSAALASNMRAYGNF